MASNYPEAVKSRAALTYCYMVTAKMTLNTVSRSLSDGGPSYQRSSLGTESVPRPRSLEADNVLNPDLTPRPEKGDA